MAREREGGQRSCGVIAKKWGRTMVEARHHVPGEGPHPMARGWGHARIHLASERMCLFVLRKIRLRFVLFFAAQAGPQLAVCCSHGLSQICGRLCHFQRSSVWLHIWRPSRLERLHLDATQRHKASMAQPSYTYARERLLTTRR